MPKSNTVLKVLLKYDPSKVNSEDERNNNTPLHWAVVFGNFEVARILLKFGASRSQRNKDGKIPLDLAKREDFNRWVQLLNSSARSKWKMVYYLCKFVKREKPNNEERRDSLADVSIITKGTWI